MLDRTHFSPVEKSTVLKDNIKQQELLLDRAYNEAKLYRLKGCYADANRTLDLVNNIKNDINILKYSQ
ncbi:hypothetical protein GS501_04745 [Saccharibacter sp. 17.LH.SD]|uniref:hypothetical protein n=1 Tax=Saccharibacter sp. 17.LH.SD TaxID=2689393 RepID=UPI0013A05F6B|nr:hypothetical protein [Saccharibacter sp. 17.LH.SD]MXV44354.1 hypothetical protein [Saccharibacter sp. 17.LH.SD]